jgi:hypothetical protein
VPLHPARPLDPERILAFGPAGSGKTTNWLNIAKFIHMTKSDSRIYVMDTDFAVDRMMAGYPNLTLGIPWDPQFNNPEAIIQLYSIFEWRQYINALADIQKKARPQDWVVVDFIGNAWSAVQEDFVMEVFHQDIGDYFLKVRKQLSDDATTLGALEGWVDWQVINPRYRGWANKLLYKGRYHIFATAQSDNLSSERKPLEDAQTRQLFARYQVKPVGQKQLPYQFHTILLTGRNSEERTITAVKDRERAEVSGLVVKNFTMDYLVNIADWKLS